jgi:hypothetical protein
MDAVFGWFGHRIRPVVVRHGKAIGVGAAFSLDGVLGRRWLGGFLSARLGMQVFVWFDRKREARVVRPSKAFRVIAFFL